MTESALLPIGPACEAPPPLAVAVDDLVFRYGNSEPVLEHIGLRVQAGEFLAIIGPNGGGKTTLLRLILGLLRPDAGTVRVFGQTPGAMNGSIGYVPQFSTLQPGFPATVLDMTLMGAAAPSLRGGGWPVGRKARKKALTCLDILGLVDYAGQPVHALSGGQRQRALVARALMSKPEQSKPDRASSGPADPFLLLLDEPTASIDPHGKFCFYEFLGRLRGEVSIIVVSHDLFMASPFFDAVAFVNRQLTLLPGASLSPEVLHTLYGQHLHECPVADIQHAGQVVHPEGCSHPACRADAEKAGCSEGHHSGTATLSVRADSAADTPEANLEASR